MFWKNKSSERFGRNITEQIPIRFYENGYFVLKDNRLMNIFEVQGKSFYNTGEDELNNQVYRLAEYYRMQKEDIKIVFMNYPTNTSKQQNFLREKLKSATSLYRKWIGKELTILENLEKYRTDRVAFIFIFANNENTYHRQVEMLKNKSSLLIKEITLEKKITILRKLYNMNKSIKV